MKKLSLLFALGLVASACGGGDDSPLTTEALGTECSTLLEKSDSAQEAVEGGAESTSVGELKTAMDDLLGVQQEFFGDMARWEETTNAEGFTNLSSVIGDMSKIIDSGDGDNTGQFLESVEPDLDAVMEKWEADSGGGDVQSWISPAGLESLPSACESLMEVVL